LAVWEFAAHYFGKVLGCLFLAGTPQFEGLK
jgi:hypothetical protein